MRNLKIIIHLSLLIVLVTCEKEQQDRTVSCIQESNYAYLDNYKIDSLCTDNICINYQPVWKELFMEKNNLTDSYFNNHIELCESEIHNWTDGASFRICYKVKVGWARAYNCDQFIIKIEKENKLYPALELPRGTYLSKDAVSLAVNNHAFSSNISKLSYLETLKFSAMETALKYLINKAKINTLCSTIIYIDESTGNLVLEAYGQYDNEVNKCIQGRIDLITGETYISDGPCLID